MSYLTILSFIFLAWFCTDQVSADKDFKEILTGKVHLIDVDSDSNVYVYLTKRTRVFGQGLVFAQKFYKLNSKKEIILDVDIENVKKILISHSNDVYVITAKNYDNNDVGIYSLQPNSTNLTKIAELHSDIQPAIPYFFALNNNGTLIFNTENGVSMIKFGETDPVSILNLENCYGLTYWEDIIIGERKESQKSFTAAINWDEPVPSARMFLNPEPRLELNIQLMDRNEAHFFLVFNGRHPRILAHKSDNLTDFQILHSQPSFFYRAFRTFKSYFYFIGNSGSFCYIGFGRNTTDEMEQESVELDVCLPLAFLFDQDETAYIPTDFRLYKIKVGEKGILRFNHFIDETDERIRYTAIDQFGSLLILGTKNLFALEKNATEPRRITKSSLFGNELIRLGTSNYYNKEIFAVTDTKLYVIEY